MERIANKRATSVQIVCIPMSKPSITLSWWFCTFESEHVRFGEYLKRVHPKHVHFDESVLIF